MHVEASDASAQCYYDVTIIQGPWCNDIFEYPVTRGTGLNRTEEVVGYYQSCDIGPDKAFVWSQAAGLTQLEMPPGYSEAQAWDINGAGQIVGCIRLTDTLGHAALWQDGQVLDLGIPLGGNFSEGNAINGAGLVVGTWGNDTTGPGLRAFSWHAGQMTDLSPYLDTPVGEACDVNDTGDIVGWLGDSAFPTDWRAYVLRDGAVTELGVIPGGLSSRASAINNRGQIVGWGQIEEKGAPFGQARAFFLDNGQMTDLGILSGFERSASLDINDAGQVVGQIWGADVADGFLWQNGIMFGLNDLLTGGIALQMQLAYGINDDGWIVGYAGSPTGTVAVLLTPIDQPPGDVDHDCTVGKNDLNLLLAAWGDCPATGHCFGDVDEDGDVDVIDLLILLGNWSY